MDVKWHLTRGGGLGRRDFANTPEETYLPAANLRRVMLRAHPGPFHAKVDGFVPEADTVNFGIICQWGLPHSRTLGGFDCDLIGGEGHSVH